MESVKVDIKNLKKVYSNKRSVWVIIACVIFWIYFALFLSFTVFNVVYVQANVIGYSMQPTFNKNLVWPENAQTSIYQDVVYANRFKKGTNGDIVLAQHGEEVLIKRVLALQGQTLILKLETDGYYYFYLCEEDGKEPVKINENYIGEFRTYMNEEYYDRFASLTGAVETSTLPKQKAELKISSGCVFLVGDNRRLSEDSTTFGEIKQESIIGKVDFYHEYNVNLWGYIWDKICSVF